jgi:hypothetical protein
MSNINTMSMIKMIIGSVKCKKNGHSLDEKVSCPFTGKSYRGCIVCGKVITV